MANRDFATRYEAKVFAIYERMTEDLAGKHGALSAAAAWQVVQAAATLTVASVIAELEEGLMNEAANWGRGA